MKRNPYIYIFIMFGVSYLMRCLPLTLIRRQIKNRTIRSFLYYVPYVTLAVMTFPAIMHAAAHPLSGLMALLAGIVLAASGAGLFPVAITCSAVVLALDFLL